MILLPKYRMNPIEICFGSLYPSTYHPIHAKGGRENESSTPNLSGGGYHCLIGCYLGILGFSLVAAASDPYGCRNARRGRHRILQHDPLAVKTSMERSPFGKNLETGRELRRVMDLQPWGLDIISMKNPARVFSMRFAGHSCRSHRSSGSGI